MYYSYFLETCDDKKVCQNGGSCLDTLSGKFCSCKAGTTGFFCENVDCDGKDCGDDADCVFDNDKEAVGCKCKMASLTFDEADRKCKGKVT